MASRPFHFQSANNVTPIPVGNTPAMVTGLSIINTSTSNTAAVKLYWGNSNNFSSGKDVPTVGTDIPAYTFALGVGTASIPAVLTAGWGSGDGPRGNGMLFVAVTVNPADSDATAPAAGAVIVSLTWQ